MNESGAYVFEEATIAAAQAALVRSGGKPYILVALTDEETGQIELTSQGFTPEQIIAGLSEAAYQLDLALEGQE